MSETKLQTDFDQQTELLEAGQQIKRQLQDRGDEATAKKLQEVLNKWQAGDINIGFCGHFSAGKSTMINQLLGKAILPSSPIPTSANLVIIRYGQPKAIIHFTDGEQKEIDVTHIEQWKDYCRNGQQVERVEIFDDQPLLAEGLQLLDTPGIDSTDETHQVATEAALHLADIIFFITDYNHVQSELNFEFIRTLKEKGKTLLLIVNQIDKHCEEELSFSLFHEKIEEGLKDWGIQLDGILYTSLKQPENPLNQFGQLILVIEALKQQKFSWIQYHAVENVRVLLKEHEQFLLAQQEDEFNEYRNQIEQIKAELNWTEQEQWFSAYVHSLQSAQLWKERLEQETPKILTNAILTPYVTTQLAQAYIESCKKEFKVGVFFSGKKTEQERESRLDALYLDLRERVKTQLEWHLKELLRKTAVKLGVQDQSFFEQIMEWTVPFPPVLLQETVHAGIVSEEYVYTYTKELVQKIQQTYRRQMEQWIDRGSEWMEKSHQDMYASEQDKIDLYRNMVSVEVEIEAIVQHINQKIEQDIMVLHRNNQRDLLPPQLSFQLQTLQRITDQEQALGDQPSQFAQLKHISAIHDEFGNAKIQRFDHLMSASLDLKQKAEQLMSAKQVLDQLSSCQTISADMERKAARLKDNRFTVCLFGAFSAGKSSFANALLGEAVLPVSPNPTTAAINQVLPPTKDYPSGSAIIRMKGTEQVKEEILIALERLQLDRKGELWECLQQIKKVDPHLLRPTLKPYYTFLSACLKGWQDAQVLLNTEFRVQREDYPEYVAVEHKACFVESIRLYHDNPITAQGIEIIDTPGADSIYSRHTNVTFNYIKNADVIIYLTYYNHAFSRADRQFLDQLGRVKDQFALDKMFFLVNAADLAESEEELQHVVTHVEDNLLRSGIRFPRIYPVSSLRTLQGKADNGMSQFMEGFITFIQQDLTQLLVDTAQRDVELGRNRLAEMRNELLGSQVEKDRNMHRLKLLQDQWREEIQQLSYHSYLKELDKEMQEQTFHIKQRLFFSFLEHVQDAFHPSVLKGKHVDQRVLSSCLNEVLHSITFQLKEELKATSLRMEGYLQKLLQRAWDEWQQKLKRDGMALSDQTFSVKDLGLPYIPMKLPDHTEKEWKEVLRHFKSPRQFFEGDGKVLLREYLEQKTNSLVDQFLQEAGTSFVSFYQDAWQREEEKFKDRVTNEIKNAIAGRIAVLQGEVSLEAIEQLIQQYDSAIAGLGGVVGTHKQLVGSTTAV